jgi:hypothetical protein
MIDPAPHIFPTRDRAKHSHLVSYPLGAEALSRALDGVPQHADLSCSFIAGNTHQFLDKPRQLCLSVVYQRRERLFNDGPQSEVRGVYAPRWSITVFAVPRDVRHAIKTVLMTVGLPEMVRPWLIDNAGIIGKTGHIALNLEYDRLDEVLVQDRRQAILPDRV